MQLCAFKRTDGAVTLIVLNPKDRARKASLPKGYDLIQATYTDATHDAEDFSFGGSIPAKSVITFVLKKV